MSRWKVILLAVLAAPLVLFGVVAGLWAAFGPDGQRVVVAPNVSLAGTDVGGAGKERLDGSLRKLSDNFAETPVRIVTPDFEIRTTAGELGLSVDVEATRSAALDVGRDDPGPLAPLRWAKSFASERPAPVSLRVDRARATDVIVEKEGDRRTDPVEPVLQAEGDRIGMAPGTDGRALDVDEILDAAPGAIDAVGAPIVIETEQVVTRPELSDDEVAEVVEQANAAASHTFTIKYGETAAELAGRDLAVGFQLRTDDGKAALGIDAGFVATLLADRLKTPPNPTGVRFDVVNGVPTAVPGQDAVVCCDEQAPQAIIDALLAGKTEVTLGTRTITAAQGVEWANSLGIKEVVGEFTTKHPCCAARVKNIHRISDLTRGVIIAPGETFSANGFVGKRTKEKGFFSAPVIEEGKFSEDFGGGVSQWATTTFNAAFFAGLDIPEHKAHSIYISRYPFGREATLAYPSVDLKIRNNTPYGVMMFPIYTDTSITVQMWSTRFAIGQQTDINKKGGCGDVTVTRTRLFVDGHSDQDKFKANYNCNPPPH